MNTMKQFFPDFTSACLAWLAAATTVVAAGTPDDFRWWPTQKAPRVVARTSYLHFQPVTNSAGVALDVGLSPDHMLATSLAGLTALAVNEGRFDEMVFVGLVDHARQAAKNGPPREYAVGYEETRKRLRFKDAGVFSPMQLLARYKDKGVYDGYILYRFDRSPGDVTSFRTNCNESVNVATSLAGLMRGVLVSEEQEAAVQQLGLKRLMDVRDKTERWLFDTYHGKLNRRHLLTQDPLMANNRDMAIAHRMMVVYGLDQPTPEAYEWMGPGGYVLGWNGPDEGGAIDQMSKWGLIMLPSNWAINLALFSAGSETLPGRPFKPFDAARIDWAGATNTVAFIMSDGDNVQWLMGDFCLNPNYWAAPEHGRFPMGWGLPYACLDQLAPATYDRLRRTQPGNATLNQHVGGYFFPDRLGSLLSPEARRDVLERHARRVNHFMKRAGLYTYMFICYDLDSPASAEAFSIFAREIEGLTGMFAIQYAPYEAGDGKVYWVKNKAGVEIPVVTAKYCIWANLDQARSGTPAKIARLLNEDTRRAAGEGRPSLSWVMTHAWSGFVRHDGPDEKAENGQYLAPGSAAGVLPTRWCLDRLDKGLKVVTPEELLWRFRMAHDPAGTQAAIKAAKRKDAR
jgi:hypothetical protein